MFGKQHSLSKIATKKEKQGTWQTEKFVKLNPIYSELFAPFVKNEEELGRIFEGCFLYRYPANTKPFQIDFEERFFGKNALKKEVAFLKNKAKKHCFHNICLRHGFSDTTTMWIMWDKEKPAQKLIFPSENIHLLAYGGANSEMNCVQLYFFGEILYNFLSKLKANLNAEMEIKKLYIPFIHRNVSGLLEFAERYGDEYAMIALDGKGFLKSLEEKYGEWCFANEFTDYCKEAKVYSAVSCEIHQCINNLYKKRKLLEDADLWEYTSVIITTLNQTACQLPDNTKHD